MSVNNIAYTFMQKTVNGQIVKGARIKLTNGKIINLWDTNKEGKYDGKLDSNEIYNALMAFKKDGGSYSSVDYENIKSLKDDDLQKLANKGDNACLSEMTLEDMEKEEKAEKEEKDEIRKSLLEERKSIDQDKELLSNLKQAAKYQQMIQKTQSFMNPFGMGIGMGMGMGMLNPFFGLGGMLGGALGGGLFNSFMPQMPTMQPDFSQMENDINQRIDEYNAKLKEYGIKDRELIKGIGDIKIEETPKTIAQRDDSLISKDETDISVLKAQPKESKPASTVSDTVEENPERDSNVIKELEKETDAKRIKQIITEAYGDKEPPSEVKAKAEEMANLLNYRAADDKCKNWEDAHKNQETTMEKPNADASDADKTKYINQQKSIQDLLVLQQEKGWSRQFAEINARIKKLESGKRELGEQLHDIKICANIDALTTLKNGGTIDLNNDYVKAYLYRKEKDFE